MNLNVVNKLIFPAPTSSYSLDTFPPNTLIWIPEIDTAKLPNPVNYTSGTRDTHTTGGADSKDHEYISNNRPRWETGRKLPALFINTPGAEFLILFYHGNGEDVGGSYRWLSVLVQLLRASGVLVSVLMVEYPGYGLCFGKPSEQGVLQNAESAYYFVRAELQWPVENLWLWGVSIGTGPSTYLAARFESGGLILMAAYESIRDVVKHLLGKAASYLISNRFENNKEIESVVCPTLLIHGKDDKLIPYQQSVRLHELCKADIKELYLAEDVGHSNFHLDRDIADPLLDFIIKLLQFRSELQAKIPVPRRVSIPSFSRIAPDDLHRLQYSTKRNSVAESTDESGSFSKLGWLFKATSRTRKASGTEATTSLEEAKKNFEASNLVEQDNSPSNFTSSVAPSGINVDQLVAMGFDESQSRDALTLSRNDLAGALEYLLQSKFNESL